MSSAKVENAPLEAGQKRITISRDALLVPALATIFYALGQFELLDYMGGTVKRLVEVGLFLILLFAGFDLLSRRGAKAFRQPFVYLGILFFVVELVFVGDTIAALGFVVATYCIILVFAVPPVVVDRTIKLLIAFCGVFSVLGLIQVVILVNNPHLLPHTVQYYLQPDPALDYELTHPIALLGMTPGMVRSVLGQEIPRMQSFLREPGLLMSYFLLPGALALLFRGKTRFWSLPIVAFSFLGFTGTVYASLVLAFCLFVGLSIPPFNRRFGRSVGLVLLAMTVFISLSPNRFTLMGGMVGLVFRNEAFLSNIKNLEFLDRYNSAMFRFNDAAQLESSAENDLIYAGRLPAYIGLVGYGRLRAGMVGVFLEVLVIGALLVSATRLSRYGLRLRLAGALVGGIVLEAAILQQYGFEAASGFLILALAFRKMQLVLSVPPARSTGPRRASPRSLEAAS